MSSVDSSPAPADRPAPKSGSSSIHRAPRDFLDMFFERWWIGALVGLAAVAVIVIFRPHFEPIYRTQVSLLFESHKDHVLNIEEVVDTRLQTLNELNTHMEQMRSKTFADYVLASFTPHEIEQIQKPYADPLHPDAPLPPLASIVRPYVNVFARRGAPIIEISVENRASDSAALIANRYALKYIEYTLDRANTGTNSAIIFLRNQAEETRAAVEAAENAQQSYRVKHNLAAIGENQNVVVQKMQALGSALVKAQIDQIDAKSLIDKVDEYQHNHRNLLEIPQILSSGQVSSLSNNIRALQTQRLALDQRYGPEWPRVKENEFTMRETQRVLDENIAKAIADLRSRYEVSVQYTQRLQMEMAETEKLARELDKTAVDYKFLEQDTAAKRVSYARIIDRLNETNITSQMANTNIRIFDPAPIPDAPADTGAAKVAMKSTAAFLGCLFVIPLGIGFLDTRMRTPGHVEESLHEPILGTIKRMKKMGETERAQVYRLHNNRDLAEAYLGVFSEIEVRSPLDFPKTLLVSSSVPNEGKSLLCSNLAAVFAEHKRRTLLIDCDLRRPTLHRYFGIKPDAGWVQWLESRPQDRPAIPSGIVQIGEYLDLLPSGRAVANPTALLDQLSHRETLQPLLQNYDLLVFDTPPAAIFPDALLLARSCHELIYVCRYRTVRPQVVRKVLDRFRGAGVSILGVVLNQMPESKSQRYGYSGYGTMSAKYYKAYAKDDSSAKS